MTWRDYPTHIYADFIAVWGPQNEAVQDASPAALIIRDITRRETGKWRANREVKRTKEESQRRLSSKNTKEEGKRCV